MTVEESRPLLDYLYQPSAPGPNSPAASAGARIRSPSWDNRCTQHFAIADFHDGPNGHADMRRVMHRVTIDGDRPV